MKGGLMNKRNSNQLNSEQQAELEALSALSDEEIDTQNIPEVVDWSGKQRGLFYRPIEHQNTGGLDNNNQKV
jgi:hypothetical protein